MKCLAMLTIILLLGSPAFSAPQSLNLTLENSCLFTKGKSFIVQSVLEMKGSNSKKVSQFYCKLNARRCEVIELDISRKTINSKNLNSWSIPLEQIKIGENSASFSFANTKFTADEKKGVTLSSSFPKGDSLKKSPFSETWTGSCR